MKSIQIAVMAALLCGSASVLAAETATRFSFPVGGANSPPQISGGTNSFHIS